VKVRKGVQHKYVGRVSRACDKSMSGYCCILLERMQQDGNTWYIAIDAYSNTNEGYAERMIRCSKLLSKYMDTSSRMSINIPIQFTTSNRLVSGVSSAVTYLPLTNNYTTTMPIATKDTHNQATGTYDVLGVLVRDRSSASNIGGNIYSPVTDLSISEIMCDVSPGTDGYVAYVGNSRPAKVKLASMLTIDVSYNKSTNSWNCCDNIAARLKRPREDILMSTSDVVMVIEVNLHTGESVRARGDRLKGNSRMVMDRLLKSYSSDIKYSVVDIWSGADIRFGNLINRCFKRYMHEKYMLRGSNVLDIGSGNGGDISIWEDMNYKVLAIEKDKTRYNVLQKKIHSSNSIRAINDDMRNMMVHLSNSTVRYHCATFMRCLGTISSDDVVYIIRQLKTYGCKKILIITMVSDGLISHTYSHDDQSFSVSYDDKDKVAVKYTIANKTVEYTDNCYSISKWVDMCSSCGYKVTLELQSGFVDRTYSLHRSDSTYHCFTDIGMCLSID